VSLARLHLINEFFNDAIEIFLDDYIQLLTEQSTFHSFFLHFFQFVVCLISVICFI